MKNIAVITGGYSGEDVISRKSAAMVMNNIDRSLYHPFLIDISRKGWFYIDGENSSSVDKNDFSIQSKGNKITFDAAILALHGTPGEDGVLQGYFDMIGLPYNTGSAFNMAITFNKYATIQLLRSAGIPVSSSVLIRKGQSWNASKIGDSLGFPCFVKPNFGGSSLGISKVKEVNEIDSAIELALKESDEVLIEAFMSGREFTCGVLQNKEGVFPIAVTEIVSKNEFFDFESKYDPNLVDEITPAPIPEDLYKRCQELAVETFIAMDCRGISRVDMILTDQGFKVIEVNTVPGMTEFSIIPQMAEASGISKTELISGFLNNIL
jgi:D-alanine-D-alanine ligase